MSGIISSLAQDDSYYLWHHCFGHLSRNVLHQAMSKVSGMPTVIIPPSLASCKGCALEKMHDQLWSTLIWLDLCLLNLICRPAIFLLLLMISLVMSLLHSFAPRMQFHSISTAWFLGLRPLLVTCLPLFVLTKKGNFWVKIYNLSSCPEVSLIRPPFPILLSRMVMQRDSIVPYLRKHKPCSNIPVCQSLSGKMLLRLHCIFIITNQCIVIIGKHPLRYSMEINLTFPTSEYLGLVLMSLSHKSSDMTSCLLKQRRWSLLGRTKYQGLITFGHNNTDDFSFPLMPYLIRLSSHTVSKIKKNYWQHLMTSKNLNFIHRIWNLIEISTFSYQ